ncbi:recombinase family protein [Methylobacterium iners]|uniref:Recombinase domain-containing protein n=1 Tax=Methylobacterium iners TaxID=418707 RepID=A0ABQ4S189_9HYPH|nr:recombinase family protein [Methylobacterium iners]GJD96244.1 hypothetical protein OCOJLMKI_3464 [Methylobacterium iners]
MRTAYVGFYWTLPVNWADFRRLPSDVEGAAQASRTIRYQRERVRQWVKEDAVSLVGEIAFMDVRTDRATEAVREALIATRRVCVRRKAKLVYVRFEEQNLWRSNPYLRRHAEEFGLELVALSPDPLTIDGRRFDPAEHFKRWRTADKEQMGELRREAYQGLEQALSVFPEGAGRWQAIAERLNGDGIRSLKGSTWTPENVRKVVNRHHNVFA